MKAIEGQNIKNVSTVGELKAAIKDLDDNIKIEQGFSESCDLVVFNIGMSNTHLSFKDGGEWSGDYDGIAYGANVNSDSTEETQ